MEDKMGFGMDIVICLTVTAENKKFSLQEIVNVQLKNDKSRQDRFLFTDNVRHKGHMKKKDLLHSNMPSCRSWSSGL